MRRAAGRFGAEAARSELRTGKTLARHGGDEFVAILPHMRATEAIRVASRIRSAFGPALAAWDRALLQPTLSIGVAEGNAASDQLDAVLQRADEALYRPKRLGRDRVQVQIRALVR